MTVARAKSYANGVRQSLAAGLLLVLTACDESEKPKPSVATVAPSAVVSAAPGDAGSPAKAKSPRWNSETGRWEKTSNGLRQTAENPTSVYNVALADERAEDLVLRVRMRAISGKIDQGGGLIWRALDAKNYYIARYNPLEKNFRVYTVQDGRRKQLASAEVDIPGDAWHSLEVRMRGDHFEGRLDGKQYLDVRDTTFPRAGAVGLWTKADAVTEFEDFELEAAKK